jgi:hypothetical protein
MIEINYYTLLNGYQNSSLGHFFDFGIIYKFINIALDNFWRQLNSLSIAKCQLYSVKEDNLDDFL